MHHNRDSWYILIVVMLCPQLSIIVYCSLIVCVIHNRIVVEQCTNMTDVGIEELSISDKEPSTAFKVSALSPTLRNSRSL